MKLVPRLLRVYHSKLWPIYLDALMSVEPLDSESTLYQTLIDKVNHHYYCYLALDSLLNKQEE